MDLLERVRVDLAAGRTWKARDRLLGAAAARADTEYLELLAEVHHAMGDLPRAGALWFVTAASCDEAEAARGAWRERHGDDAVELWRSLPALVRVNPQLPAVRELAESAGRLQRDRNRASRARRPDAAELIQQWRPIDWVGVGCGTAVAILGFALIGAMVVGLFTIFRWLF